MSFITTHSVMEMSTAISWLDELDKLNQPNM